MLEAHFGYVDLDLMRDTFYIHVCRTVATFIQFTIYVVICNAYTFV